MRNLDEYDLIVSDIDDTLIYGWWTDLMHHTWNAVQSPLLSKILMFLQNKFHLYKVNIICSFFYIQLLSFGISTIISIIGLAHIAGIDVLPI